MIIINKLFWSIIGLLFLLFGNKSRGCAFNRILVMRYGFIGDVLQTTPFLKYLREKFPKSKIDYWVSKKAAVALENNPNVDTIIDADDFGLKDEVSILSVLKTGWSLRKKKYDCAILLSSEPLGGIIAWFGAIGHRVGLANSISKSAFLTKSIIVFPDSKISRQKIINDVMELIDGTVVPAEYPIELFWAKKDENAINSLLSKKKSNLVAFFPGGGENIQYRPWANRKWSPEKWIGLAQNLLNEIPVMDIILLGSGLDQTIVNTIAGNLPVERVVNLVNKTTFSQLGPVLKRCRALITNDTASVFVASAVSCPSVVLYGPEWPERAKPLNTEEWHPIWVDVVCREECAALPRNSIQCQNCCMKEINVETVLTCVLKLVHNRLDMVK